MKVKDVFSRLLLVPLAIFNQVIIFIKNGTRDLEYKKKYNKAIIENGCVISKDSVIGKAVHIYDRNVIMHCNIGDFSYINKDSQLVNVTVGRYCSIASKVIIGLGIHPTDFFSTSPIFYRRKNPFNINLLNDNEKLTEEYKSISIGSDVWVGMSAIIMDGIKIGHGAIVAAGAVVTKDVPPYAIVAGIPARVIKYRFNEEKIKKLLVSKWWLKEPNEALSFFKNLS